MTPAGVGPEEEPRRHASPAQVRGAGFAAFNLASVVFGAAAAPLVTATVASQFGNDYPTAFLLVMPIAFVGAGSLLLARRHVEKDSAKVFEAVALAMAANQAEESAYAAAEATARPDGARQDEVDVPEGEDGET